MIETLTKQVGGPGGKILPLVEGVARREGVVQRSLVL